MATFNLTKSTTVATLKELFYKEFGAKLRIYLGRCQAKEGATLGELGLTNEGNFECRASLTVGSLVKRMQNEHGLKVKVYTCDEWVAVLDSLTLESAGKVKKNAVKADMESMIAYQRTNDIVETATTSNVETEKVAAKATKAQSVPVASKGDGELPGHFTINSKGDKICFSRGLLQFNPVKYEFRFAENQYDIIGKDNEKIAPNYDGWIDLFGWGTSGYMGCQPTETSSDFSDYGPASGGIAGTNYDWGVYNPITNGGNKEGLWRTPTADEWRYLTNSRPNADKLKVECTVCGIKGYLLLPDDFWNNRLCMPLDTSAIDYSVNQYTAEQWNQLEALGAVFMPDTGFRRGCTYCNTDYRVWTSDVDVDDLKCAKAGYCSFHSSTYRSVAEAVRLIKDVK